VIGHKLAPAPNSPNLASAADSAVLAGILPLRSPGELSVLKPALAVLACLGLMTLPAAAQTTARAGYIVTLGGINVATVDIGLEDDGARYRLDLAARVTGLGSLVSSGTAEAQVSGRSNASGLTSEEFDLSTRAGSDSFDVDISYSARTVSAFQVNPPLPNSYDRVAIERSHLTNVGDMLSAFIIKGGQLDASLCQRSLRIFTGVERFDLGMAFAGTDNATSPRTGYQGPVVLCQLDYRPISGHYQSSEMTQYLDEVSRILVWYMPLGQTGYFIPYRALVGTSAGDLSMILVSLR